VSGFYGVIAQLAFVLLGLWWVVVQFKYTEWMQSPRHRHMAYDICLLFLLAGTMSLFAMVDPTQSLLWRIAFASGAVLGGIETAFLTRSVARQGPVALAIHVATLAAYVLILLIAVRPGLPADVGVSLRPIQVEAILITVLLFLGVHITWNRFTSLSREASGGQPSI
jgi:hypothetical protein